MKIQAEFFRKKLETHLQRNVTDAEFARAWAAYEVLGVVRIEDIPKDWYIVNSVTKEVKRLNGLISSTDSRVLTLAREFEGKFTCNELYKAYKAFYGEDSCTQQINNSMTKLCNRGKLQRTEKGVYVVSKLGMTCKLWCK